MQSVIFEEFGSPRKVLKTVERPIPQPGPGQVRVKMVLAPIHNHDLMTITGHYGVKPERPATAGTEALGIVDALGEGVTNLSVGQRVTGGGIGTWSDYYLAPANGVVPLPDGIPDATACQLISMPVSAFRLLLDLQVQPGDWIIQNAANGAVGKMLARLAAERGVQVVNLVRRDAAIAELAAEGIGNVVSTESADWQEKVRALTGGAPIRRALDSVSGRAANDMMDLVADEGWLISFGALSGRPLQIDPDNLLFKRAIVKGFWAYRPPPTASPEEIRAQIGRLIAEAASGELSLPIAETFDLNQAAAAAEASGTPGRPGKIALRGGA